MKKPLIKEVLYLIALMAIHAAPSKGTQPPNSGPTTQEGNWTIGESALAQRRLATLEQRRLAKKAPLTQAAPSSEAPTSEMTPACLSPASEPDSSPGKPVPPTCPKKPIPGQAARVSTV